MILLQKKVKEDKEEKDLDLSDKNYNPVDRYVGKRIKERRRFLRKSQKKLAEELGITFQQIQKYERGANRVGASRLYDFSRVLQVPVQFFFENLEGEVSEQSPRMELFTPNKGGMFAFGEDTANIDYDPMHTREAIELVTSFRKIKDRDLAKKIFEWIVSLAQESEEIDISKKKQKIRQIKIVEK